MSSFDDMDERLADWVDGTMDAKQRERFEAEMRVSPALREQVAEYEQTVASVRQALTGPELATQQASGRDAADRIMATLAAEVARGDQVARGDRVASGGAVDGADEPRAGLHRFGLHRLGVGRSGWPLVWAVASAAAVLLIALLVDAWGHSSADPKRHASSAAPFGPNEPTRDDLQQAPPIDQAATDTDKDGGRAKKAVTVDPNSVLQLELGSSGRAASGQALAEGAAPAEPSSPSEEVAFGSPEGESGVVRRFKEMERMAEKSGAEKPGVKKPRELPQTRKGAKEYLRSGGEAMSMRKRASRAPSSAVPPASGPGSSGPRSSGPGSSGPGSSGPAGPSTGGAVPKSRSARGGGRGGRGAPQSLDDRGSRGRGSSSDRSLAEQPTTLYRYSIAPSNASGETLPLITLTGKAGVGTAKPRAFTKRAPSKGGETGSSSSPTVEAEEVRDELGPLQDFYELAVFDSLTMSAGRSPAAGEGSGAVAPPASSLLAGGLRWSRVAPLGGLPAEARARAGKNGQEPGAGARPGIGGGAGAAADERSQQHQQYWLVEGPRSRVASLLRAVRKYADRSKLELRSGEVLVAASASTGDATDEDREDAPDPVEGPSRSGGSKSKSSRVPPPAAAERSNAKDEPSEPRQRIVIRLRARAR